MIKLDVSGLNHQDLEQIRVHVLANNFNNSHLPSSFDCAAYFHPEVTSQTTTSKQPSSYYSNKVLSDEAAYVNNRQREPSFIGNNLEKPQIFLKKILIRETKINEEELNAGIPYNRATSNDYLFGDMKQHKKKMNTGNY